MRQHPFHHIGSADLAARISNALQDGYSLDVSDETKGKEPRMVFTVYAEDKNTPIQALDVLYDRGTPKEAAIKDGDEYVMLESSEKVTAASVINIFCRLVCDKQWIARPENAPQAKAVQDYKQG